MTADSKRTQRCGTCRFWVPDSSECRRRAPCVVALARADDESRSRTATVWPVTSAEQWCGEWEPVGERATAPVSIPAGECVAVRLFLARVAPALDARDPALLESLLEQLPSDVRRVLVRTNGLDGRPPCGLKDVAREFKMSQGHVRALLATGDALLTEVVALLSRTREGAPTNLPTHR